MSQTKPTREERRAAMNERFERGREARAARDAERTARYEAASAARAAATHESFGDARTAAAAIGQAVGVDRNINDSLAGLQIIGERLHYRGESQPVSGASATVQQAGGIDRRTTATRVLAGATLGGKVGAVIGAVAKKKVDRREVYLIVSGTTHTWSVDVDPRFSRDAQRIAAKINELGRA